MEVDKTLACNQIFCTSLCIFVPVPVIPIPCVESAGRSESYREIEETGTQLSFLAQLLISK